jgi:hypothetical protein
MMFAHWMRSSWPLPAHKSHREFHMSRPSLNVKLHNVLAEAAAVDTVVVPAAAGVNYFFL